MVDALHLFLLTLLCLCLFRFYFLYGQAGSALFMKSDCEANMPKHQSSICPSCFRSESTEIATSGFAANKAELRPKDWWRHEIMSTDVEGLVYCGFGAPLA
ncbi:hypothetical protein K432DRAFT_384261 [Lepidopterella palustris CBS 459.81]|uniref:Uncharacterized protein n=1 Tax=Lepidopterella palustris CBS 459.81 TaxID=1314670 RepID=A0A8E2JCX7_9PEZI|nr:hypothetical protein K432DRAFT_384261 [Lepidopterella palustris CBS 459.81]